MTRQRLATLLRLEVGIPCGGFWVAVIQHVADQVQRSPILGKPITNRAPQVMNDLQAFQDSKLWEITQLVGNS